MVVMQLWEFPEGGPEYNIDEPLVTLTGHRRKVAFVEFNPVANLIIASASADPDNRADLITTCLEKQYVRSF